MAKKKKDSIQLFFSYIYTCTETATVDKLTKDQENYKKNDKYHLAELTRYMTSLQILHKVKTLKFLFTPKTLKVSTSHTCISLLQEKK